MTAEKKDPNFEAVWGHLQGDPNVGQEEAMQALLDFRFNLWCEIEAAGVTITVLRARVTELEAQAGLYSGQNNFRFHVLSDQVFDATPPALEWLETQRNQAKAEERERIIALLKDQGFFAIDLILNPPVKG